MEIFAEIEKNTSMRSKDDHDPSEAQTSRRLSEKIRTLDGWSNSVKRSLKMTPRYSFHNPHLESIT
jgi:hypothetical protein